MRYLALPQFMVMERLQAYFHRYMVLHSSTGTCPLLLSRVYFPLTFVRNVVLPDGSDEKVEVEHDLSSDLKLNRSVRALTMTRSITSPSSRPSSLQRTVVYSVRTAMFLPPHYHLLVSCACFL